MEAYNFTGSEPFNPLSVDYTDYDDSFVYGDFNNDDDEVFAKMNCTELLDLMNIADQVMKPMGTELFTAFVYIALTIIGVIGNGLVLFVIFGGKETTKTVANIYIWNLALADLLFVMSLPFSVTQRLLMKWPFGDFLCKASEALKYQNCFSSVFFLTAMSVDRYFAVVHVVNSVKYRTSRNTFFVCFGIWTVSLSMTIPLLVNMHIDPNGMCVLNFKQNDLWIESGNDFSSELPLASYDDVYENSGSYGEDSYYDTEDCKELRRVIGDGYDLPLNTMDYALENYTTRDPTTIGENETLPFWCDHPASPVFRSFLWFSFISLFAIPLFVMTLCYVLIVMKILKPTEMKTRSTQTDRKRKKVTRMVVSMVLCFFFCWTPFHVFHLIKIKGIMLSQAWCQLVRDITFILAYSNSSLNPILYTFLGHNFSERLHRSMTITLRSLSLSTFTKYTSNNNNTTSRAETCKRTEPNIYETTDRNKSKSTAPIYKKVATTGRVGGGTECGEHQQHLIEEA